MIDETYKPMTRFSEEQVIIAQLQGSTESSSQLLRTPWGSIKSLLIAIRASTDNKENKPIILDEIVNRRKN